MATRLADVGLNTTKWGGRGSGITAPGIITYQMDQICQSHAPTALSCASGLTGCAADRVY